MGKYQRKKGHQFERDIAIKFREIFPGARRHLEYQDGECFGVDLAKTDPYKVQCKKLAQYASVNTIFEVQCDEMLGDVPVLVTAGDNKPAMAVIPLDEFLRLLKRLYRPVKTNEKRR